MALNDNMRPHIKQALLEIPTAIRAELLDALLQMWGWEEYRATQNPPLDDTQANQFEYVGMVLTKIMIDRLRTQLVTWRNRNTESSIQTDFDA